MFVSINFFKFHIKFKNWSENRFMYNSHILLLGTKIRINI